jgi:allantoinase
MAKKIYSRRCWLDHHLREATLTIENGRITAVQTGSPASWEGVTDFGSDIVMPGVIDAHVHINEPGRTEWEGFETATRAAAAGGTTFLAEMPLNASPVTTNVEALRIKKAAAIGKMHVHCQFYGGLIPGNLPELPALLGSGVPGIKAFLVHSGIDEFPNVSMADLEAAMPLIAAAGVPLLVHCEWESGIHNAALSAQPRSYGAYLQSRPKSWENEAIARMIDLCRRCQCPVHIVHLASAEALPLIVAARAEGLPLTVETCVQYLYFAAEDIPDGNPLYKCAPPIREKVNQLALKDALSRGWIDFIATDHSPAPPDLKALDSGDLSKAWGGIAGIQFLLSAAWTALQSTLSIEKFIPLLTEHPARFLRLLPQKGSLAPGSDADLAVWSPEKQFRVEKESVWFRHPISPYIGETLAGRVTATYLCGEQIFENRSPYL